MPKTFSLTLAMGNDAMLTAVDVATALEQTAASLRKETEFLAGRSSNIRDVNGNTVGKWRVKGPKRV